MIKRKALFFTVLFLLSALFLPGCMTSQSQRPGSPAKKVLPLATPLSHQCLIKIDDSYNPSGHSDLREIMISTVKKTQWLGRESKFTLELKLDTEIGSEPALNFFAFLTLYLVPARFEHHFTLTATLRDYAGQSLVKTKATSAVTTWVQIFLGLWPPHLWPPFRQSPARQNLTNLTRKVLSDLVIKWRGKNREEGGKSGKKEKGKSG